MAVDGIYSITFRGAADWGMGLLVLQNNTITGADVAGGIYDGNFTETADAIEATISLTVPPGVMLVQGTVPSPEVQEIPFSASIPKEAIEKQAPVLIQMPVGPVNIIFKFLRPL